MRWVGLALVVLVGGCKPKEIETAPPTLMRDSILRTHKISDVRVTYADWLASEKRGALEQYEVGGQLSRAVTESLDKGGHIAPGGTAVTITVAEFRLRAPGLAVLGTNAGSDHIRVVVSVAGEKYEAEAWDTRGLGSLSRERRLAYLLNDLLPAIVDRL